MKSQIWKRFIRRKTSLVGLIVLLFFIFMALFGPNFTKYDPIKINLKEINQGISLKHFLGTDSLGRDTYTRLVYGSRTTLSISFIGVFWGSFIGIMLGVLSGYFGGWVDQVISRIIDILLAFPSLLLAIVIVAILGTGLENTIIAIGFSSIPVIARMVRSIVLTIREVDYIKASQVMGISNFRILLTHVIPNAISQIIVNITINLGTAIIATSSLSFLGLGVQPPNPEWGMMLSTAKETMRSHPLASLAPGVAITLVVLSFSLVGDGLRDALDPKLKNTEFMNNE